MLQGKPRRAGTSQGKTAEEERRGNQIGRDKAERDKAREGKGRQGKARQGKARQGKARQGKGRQGKTQNRPQTRQSKTTQNEPFLYIYIVMSIFDTGASKLFDQY